MVPPAADSGLLRSMDSNAASKDDSKDCLRSRTESVICEINSLNNTSVASSS